MRLINVETRKLEEFRGNEIPPYAILSHTWGAAGDELSFSDINAGNIKKAGQFKLEGCCEQAKKDKLGYVWIDTCCINKADSTELGEAINSMFRWYRQASICYAHLSDVSFGARFLEPESHHGSGFFSSRWFRRGWTLQELLAPRDMCFYDQAWKPIGSRVDMSTHIKKITGIPQRYLLGWEDFRMASVAQRMSWASNRETTKEEDIAYCLIGVFEISMDMRYGERGEEAFIRLQRQIMEKTGDPSILAWGLDPAEATPSESTNILSAGILGTAPSNFANCGRIVLNRQAANLPTIFNVSGGRLRVDLPLHTTSAGEIYGLLNCGPNTEQVVGIPLRKTPADEYLRPQGRCPILLPDTATADVTRAVHILIERQSEAPNRRYWLRVDGLEETNLKRNGDYPPVTWEQGRALIAEAAEADAKVRRRYLTRFSTEDDVFMGPEGPPDIVVVLDVTFNSSTTKTGSQLQVQHHVMLLSGTTALKRLSQKLMYVRPEALNKKIARHGDLNVKVAIEEEPMTEDAMLVIKLALTSSMPEMTVSANRELDQVHWKLQFVKTLQEEDKVREEAEELGRQRTKSRDISDERRQQLAAAKEILQRLKEEQRSLEERQRSLEGELEKEERDMEQLKEKENAATKKLGGLLGRQSRIQQYLDEYETQQGPGNWMEMIVNTLLNGSKSGSDLNDAGGVDPNRMQMSRAVHSEHSIDSQTPLSWAASNGHGAVARSLVERGAAIEAKDKDGRTPLIIAACYGHEAVVRVLVDKGADLEARDKNRWTPLMMAAWNGHEAVARLLIENGADHEAKDKEPLFMRASQRHEAMARLFMSKGADLEPKPGDIWTQPMFAKGHEAVTRLFRSRGQGD